MIVTVLGLKFTPFRKFIFHQGGRFFSFLSEIHVNNAGKYKWQVTASYKSLVQYQRSPGQLFVWLNLGHRTCLIVFSQRRPFIYTEVSDVENNVQVELG
jgi:hypothetical protein